MLVPKCFYLFPALYNWMKDSQLTPYIIININYPNTIIPKDYAQDGRIRLNISEEATDNFCIKHNTIYFNAAFDMPLGIVAVEIPIRAIIAIYPSEITDMIFFLEENIDDNFDTIAASNKNAEFTVVE